MIEVGTWTDESRARSKREMDSLLKQGRLRRESEANAVDQRELLKRKDRYWSEIK